MTSLVSSTSTPSSERREFGCREQERGKEFANVVPCQDESLYSFVTRYQECRGPGLSYDLSALQR
jgi:hypothetical protein